MTKGDDKSPNEKPEKWWLRSVLTPPVFNPVADTTEAIASELPEQLPKLPDGEYVHTSLSFLIDASHEQ